MVGTVRTKKKTLKMIQNKLFSKTSFFKDQNRAYYDPKKIFFFQKWFKKKYMDHNFDYFWKLDHNFDHFLKLDHNYFFQNFFLVKCSNNHGELYIFFLEFFEIFLRCPRMSSPFFESSPDPISIYIYIGWGSGRNP